MKKTLAAMLALGFVAVGISGCSLTIKGSAKTTDESKDDLAAPTLTFAQPYIEETSATQAMESIAALPDENQLQEDPNALPVGTYNCGKDSLEVFDDGTALMNVDDKEINLTWDKENFYSDEEFPDKAAKYNYDGGHLHFGYKDGDDYKSFDFNFTQDQETHESMLDFDN